VSVGSTPHKVTGIVRKEFFAFFISDKNQDLALQEEIALSIEIPV